MPNEISYSIYVFNKQYRQLTCRTIPQSMIVDTLGIVEPTSEEDWLLLYNRSIGLSLEAAKAFSKSNYFEVLEKVTRNERIFFDSTVRD